jgi:trehalose 6-phosphate synthase
MASLVRDMLFADLIGFQTESDLRNFATAAQMMAGAIRLPGNALQFGNRRVRLGVFPVEIDAHAFSRTAGEMAGGVEADQLQRSLEGQALILGIDRLDPTKGLPQRFAGVRRLFEKHTQWQRRATVLQIAATSRKDVQSYQDLRETLDGQAGALNADLGMPDWSPLRFITRGASRDVVAGYMRVARVGLVTPVRDGMNLVAKEFVAAQDPADPGVLVLSRFAGAARQLDAALLINPHDADAIASALHAALAMGLSERQDRWQALWTQLEDRTPYRWGVDFVGALVRAAGVPPVGERGRTEEVTELAADEALPPERIQLLDHIGTERDPLRIGSLRSSETTRRQLN